MTRDLFGEVARAPAAQGEMDVSLVLHDETAKAWLLGETQDVRAAQWTPKSQGRRGEGRDANIWTVPVWLARDRGWL